MVDIAIYHPALQGIHAKYDGEKLSSNGYTYGFLTDGLLGMSKWADGRLCPDGPEYKALVLDHQNALQLDTAKQIFELAQAGLPVIIVGHVPSASLGLPISQEDEVRQVFKGMTALENVAFVEDNENVLAVLRSRKIG